MTRSGQLGVVITLVNSFTCTHKATLLMKCPSELVDVANVILRILYDHSFLNVSKTNRIENSKGDFSFKFSATICKKGDRVLANKY